MNKLAVLFCSLTCLFCGCDETPQARYDAMTGEKLPEKRPISCIYRCAKGCDYEVCRTHIDGHLYLILGSSARYDTGSIIHAESCPCKTNNLNSVHD